MERRDGLLTKNPGLVVGLGLAVAMAGLVIGWLASGGFAEPVSGAPPVAAIASELDADERSTVELFERVSPSAAFITSLALRRERFSLNLYEIPRGSGSGFVWDEIGHVVTNFHVIRGSDAARVTLADRSTWDAELVGVAPDKDLAVLRIDAPRQVLRPIQIGSSRDLRVGQKVYAIGNPFGLDQTLTTGIISALGREIESLSRIPIRDVIQTDAAINPGNSGGPLLDSSGRLIGVNTAIYSPSGAYAGIGFAIPVDTVGWVVPELIAKGRIERPTLGVELVSARTVSNLGIEGALVMRVARGSGADRAGIQGTYRDRFGRVQLGDVITEIEGRAIASTEDLLLALDRRRVGDVVDVTIVRDGVERTVPIELGPASR